MEFLFQKIYYGKAGKSKMPMTPDEVVSNTLTNAQELGLIAIFHSDILSPEEKLALKSAILLIQDYQKLKEEIDRLRVQLAGCGVAALGYATGKNAIEKGSYGYSASFQDVLDLWDKHQKLRERINEEKIQMIMVDTLNKTATQKAQAIVTYLQQPTEPIGRDRDARI